MTPSRKNVVWFGGGHWCDLGVVKPSIAGCGRIILFLLEPVASLGRELWLTFSIHSWFLAQLYVMGRRFIICTAKGLVLRQKPIWKIFLSLIFRLLHPKSLKPRPSSFLLLYWCTIVQQKILSIKSKDVQWCYIRFGRETIHPKKNFTSMNLLQMSCGM